MIKVTLSNFNLNLWNEPSPFQNSQAYEQKNHNWDVLRNYGQYVGNYINGIIDSWEVRFSAQMSQIPQPNELIDARVDAWGHTYNNLREHIVNIETTTVRVEDNNSISTGDMSNVMAVILQVKDLTTSSSPLRYATVGTVNFNLPQGALMTTTINQLAVAPD